MSVIDRSHRILLLGIEMGKLLQMRKSSKRRALMRDHIRKAKDLGIFLADDVADIRGGILPQKLTKATKV
jgi:hypothetical protein